MSNRNFGGYITTGTVSANSTSVSGVWTLSQYMFQKANGLWPGSQGYFLFSGNPTSIDESTSTTFFANTTNIPNNTTVYWTIQNITTNADDFVETSNSFVISNNTGSFIVRTRTDLTTEGSESFQIALRQDSNTGPILTTSPAITLSDTSVTPPPAIDVFLVGGGGGQPGSFSPGWAGGGGGGAVLSSNNFTGFQFGTSYSVTLGAGSTSTASSTSVNGTLSAGPSGLALISAGGQGAAFYNGGFQIPSSGGNGGGAAGVHSTSRFNNQTYLYGSASSSGTASLTANDQLRSTYPGIFTYSGFDGLAGTVLNSGIAFEASNQGYVVAGSGGGGAGGTFSTVSINGGTQTVYINGRNGLLNSMDNNYYGGGGPSYALGFRNQQRSDLTGSPGLGGGTTANQGGGNGGFSTASGGSGVAFFKFETSKISASTSGTVTTTTSGIHTIVKFTSSGTINFTRI